MKMNLQLLVCTLLFLATGWTTGNAQLYINEFMASNGTSITDEAGDNEDWIEIYNAGTSAVNLAGYYMSDDTADPLQWQIAATDASLTTVPAGGYLILWADSDNGDGANHLDFKLGASGESIVLTAPDGTTLVDQYTFDVQFEDVSFGRTEDGGSDWDFFGEPTPGASNDTPAGAPQVATPVVSIRGGLFTSSTSVSISTATPDAEIRYTTDGSVPTGSSSLYNGSISINSTTPLRVKAFLNPLLPSETITETYLVNTNHKFPIVAYTADPDELFDPSTGMYTNYEEDIEINVNAELYEPDGTQGFNQRFESEINGTGSASADQKSLALKAKSSLGSATIDYQIFPNFEEDKYRSLILRNSGQDNNITMFRDAMASSLVLDISDINGARSTIKTPEVFGQAYRPGVTYINGEYWGIMNIRERTDKRYIRVRFGLDDNEIDYIENLNEVKEGDIDAWEELTDFLEDNSLSSETNFQFVDDRVDMSNYIDYLAFNIYIDNADWPGNNIRRFRERVPEGQWRWLTYDLDFSFGLFVRGQDWNSGFNDANSLERLLTLNGFGWPNPDYATLLFRRLMENEAWRTRFINRTADQLNLLYDDDRVVGRIDDFQEEYSSEIEQHVDRWVGFLNWEEKIQIMRNFANGRADNVRDHFVSEIDDINGISNLTINLNSASQGEVALSTISIHEANAPFTGNYFEGIEIPITAFPNRGYVLESWSGGLSGNDPFESVNINNNTTITANFAFGSTATDRIVINEINYNSSDQLDSDDWVELYNPSNAVVDISGWYFEDESGNFFGLPANTLLSPGAYLVLAESKEKFSQVYPQVTNVLGDFGSDPRGFGLSGGGERITLKNANGTLIDEVEYDDKSPWPTAADGDGPTLQLISPDLDNALAASWEAIPATPGALNGTNTGQNQSISFQAIANQFTTNAPFSINASASSGLAVSFTILSGPATISGNTITLTGATGTVTVQANQNGNSVWNPAPSVNQSFNVTAPPIGGDYCEAQGNAPWVEYIQGVELNDLSNFSGKNQYSDFTNNAASLSVGTSYDITLTAGYSWQSFTEYFRVWIDYNQNGIFESPAEIAYSGILSDVPNGTGSGAITGSINVPANASSGTTRMRIAMQRGAYAEPCGSFPNGEVEDYTIIIGEGSGAVLTLNNCPGNIERTAAIGATTVAVNWSDPTASTTCAPSTVNVNQVAGPSSGSAFGFGTTTVRYAISDQCGNTESCSFTVTINPPDNGSINLTCSDDLTVTAESGQSGATVNWSVPTASTTCPNGGLNVTQNGGASNGSFFAVGVYQISYVATDECGNETSCVFNLTVQSGGNPGEYCESSGDFPWEDYISNVRLNTIDNASSKRRYSDFTDISTTLAQGLSYDLLLTTSYSWFTYDEYWKVWIDYNQNGQFEEPAEIAYAGILSAPANGTSTANLTGSFIVPTTVLSGSTRMRVSMSREGMPSPCGVFAFGEVEDYTVNFSAGSGANMMTSNRQLLIDGVQVFPNPAVREVTIAVEDQMQVERIEVFNIASQKVTDLQGIEGQQRYQINVRNWQESVYFAQVHLKNGQRITQRFVIGTRF